MKKRNLIVAAVLLIVLIVVVGAVGVNRANSAAENYDHQVAAWKNTNFSTAAHGVTTAAFSNDVIIDRLETSAELKAESTHCDALQQTRKTVAGLMAPSLGSNPFGFLSSNYKAASLKSKNLHSSLAAYQSQAAQPLTEITMYCSVYIKEAQLGQEQAKAQADLKALSDPYGPTSATGTICNNPAGCAPADGSKLAAYRTAFEKLYIDLYQKQYALEGTKSCPLTDLRPVCAVTDQFAPKLKSADVAYADVLKNSATIVGSAALLKASQDSQTVLTQYKDAKNAAYLKLSPGYDTADSHASVKLQVLLLKKYEARLAGLQLR
jgi:hypothetical protein